MRNFGIRCSLFVLGFILFSSLNLSINQYFINTNPPKLAAETIIMGDSHTLRAINPRELKDSDNISQPAEPYFLTYFKLRKLLQSHKSIDRIVVGFSYSNMSENMERWILEPQRSTEMSRRLYPLASFSDLRNLDLDYYVYLKVFYRNMCIYPKFDHFGYIGSFQHVPGGFPKAAPRVMKAHFFWQNRLSDFASREIEYLYKLINLATQNGIKVILVATPLYKEFTSIIPGKFKRHFDETAAVIKEKYRNVEIWDYAGSLADPKLFNDSDHLNAAGAKVFTRMIRARLDRLELEESMK